MAYLASVGVARKTVGYHRSDAAYCQGDPALHVLYIQRGGVKLSVVNEVGKMAVVGMLVPREFFGEGCLAGQTARVETATAITSTIVVEIGKEDMIRVLHTERAFSDSFVSYILLRGIQIEEALIDQLFNSSEKRLARTLLQLGHCGPQTQTIRILPRVSQEELADMIGTTRPRVNFFMNKFKGLGLINYSNGCLHINPSLLNAALRE